MKKQIDYKKKFAKLIAELIKDYPDVPIGRHISTALSDYGDFWGISDKELCYALEKYEKELSLDLQNIAPDAYVAQIQEDANKLFEETEEDEEDEY